jgi:UDP-glucose 4-epimerase
VKIVFASTRQLYGRPDYLPVDENHLLRPVDINGVNKMAGEWYHILYNNIYGIRTCSLRLTNTYGPRMRIKDARQTFLGVWVKSLLQGQPVEVWGGGQLRDFSYVEDVVDAMLMAACDERVNGQIYNVGGDRVISLLDLAHLMVRINGGGEVVVKEFPPDRKIIDIGDYYSNDSALRECLGWAPRIPLEEGLKLTLDYYREHGGRYL